MRGWSARRTAVAWSCGGAAPIGGTLVRFDVEVHYLTGTGRLEGVTGTANTVAVLDAATGQFHYDTDGTWTLP